MANISVFNLEVFGVAKWVVDVVVGLLAIACLCIYQFLQHKSSPGPRAWPIFGSTFELLGNLNQLHDWILKYAQQYDTFRVSTFLSNYIFTVDPVIMDYVFKKNWKNYGKGKVISSQLSAFYGNGIFISNGEQWEWHRQILQRQLFSSIHTKYNLDLHIEAGIEVSSMLIQLASKGTKEIEMQNVFRRMAFDTIFQNVCGVKLKSLSSSFLEIDFIKAFETAKVQTNWRTYDPFWKLKRFFLLGPEAILKENLTFLDEFLYKIIERRRNEVKDQNDALQDVNGDLLSRILLLFKDDPKVDSDQNIRDVIVNIIEAGRRTTVEALCWTFFMICSHPHVETKILQELSKIMEDKGVCVPIQNGHNTKGNEFFMNNVATYAHLLNHDNLSEMHYLHATVTETLRLYPSVPCIAKEALSYDKLPNGMRVKKGDFVNVVPYSMARMQFLWGLDATDFKPERWLKDGLFQPESSCKFSTFGVGPRSCIGKDEAYVQVKMTIAILLWFFKFKNVVGQNVTYQQASTLKMSTNGLLLEFEPRDWQDLCGSKYVKLTSAT
ncbi:hypothetical protein O6H91_06G117400 [Diphasiastrum complanatum]|uniref:Uncharacterized protein n=2 Tax=Diphasiastrum complanatum TaxID=34168 RepID=A0ACC2DHY8_DIPCM|nr:hypothetical protein O6H91_06G117400 [Diphasiastrum complanatum]KAJ7553903.1 hypothetical protein O6H91_06G117400 [Diphasiastrum complanatum]